MGSLPGRVVRGRKAILGVLAAATVAGVTWGWLHTMRSPRATQPRSGTPPAPLEPAPSQRSALARVLHELGEMSAAGTVLNDLGAPVENARICASAQVEALPAIDAQQCALTDRDGYYQLTPLPQNDGRVSVTAAAPDHATQTTTFVIATQPLNAWGDLLVDFTLSPAEPNVLGEVVDATGGVVPGARLRVVGPALNVSAVSDASGLFALHLPEGTHTLLIDAAGFAGLRRAFVAPTLRVTSTLMPESILSGLAVGPDGEPVAEASIRALFSSNSGQGFEQGPAIPIATTETDDLGRFTLRRLPAGSYAIVAEGDNLIGDTPTELLLNEHKENLVLRLNSSATLSGRFPSAHLVSLPCGPARLELTTRASQAHAPARPIPRDAVEALAPQSVQARHSPIHHDGSFRFEQVSPGRHQLRLYCKQTSGHLVVKDGIELTPGQRQDLGVVPFPRFHGLTISAVDATGQPIAEAVLHVEAIDSSIDAGSSPAYDTRPAMLRTHRNGLAHLLGAPTGRYRIRSPFAFLTEAQEIELGAQQQWTEAAVKFKGTASLTVEVVDELDGYPQDDLQVFAIPKEATKSGTPPSNAGRLDATDALTQQAIPLRAIGLGRYRAQHLQAGRYLIQVSDGCNPSERDGSRRTVEVRPSQPQMVTLEVRRDGLLQGVVVDEQGSAMPGVWVAACSPRTAIARPETILGPVTDPSLQGTSFIAQTSCFALTDAEGQFLIPSVSSNARFDLHVIQPALNETITPDAIANAPLVLTLPSPVALVGEVIAADGSPADLRSAQAQLRGSNIRYTAHQLDRGRFAFDHLPVGEVTIEVHSMSGSQASVQVSLPHPAGLRLQLPPSPTKTVHTDMQPPEHPSPTQTGAHP